MERKVKIVQVGLGKIGKIVNRYVRNKGADIVAAFARNPDRIGMDLGTYFGYEPQGVAISSVADMGKVLNELQPDLCVIATKASLGDAMEAIECCLTHHVNVLDIGENTFWPWTDDAETAKRLDALAKENGVTITGSGYPDVCWGALITAFAASCNGLKKIICNSFLNLESYNADYMYDYHGVGLTVDEFKEKFGAGVIHEIDGHVPCLPGDQNAWLCAKLGLTVTDQTMEYVPVIRETDFWSDSLQQTIPAGRLEGMLQVCHTDTAEGIEIELRMGGKMDVTGAAEHTEWILEGDPTSKLVWDDPQTYELTCANAVNRIPDIINAEPGYVTTDRMPVIRFMPRPMNEYVNKE